MALGPFAVLGEERTFRIYWLGQLVSLTGSWMQQVAQAWVVVTLTHSTAAIATVSFVASLPMLALTMHGGVIADRFDRRKILIVTQAAFAALAFAYGGLYASGWLNLPWVYVLSLFLGTVMAFDFPALQALVPELVPPPRIPDAVALNQTLMHGTRMIGPAIAGLVMAATSPAMAFACNGVSFFAVIYTLAIIRTPPREPHAHKRGAGGLGEAIRYVRQQPLVSALIGNTALNTILMFPFFVIFSAAFIKDVLHGGERDFGIVMSASGCGAMAGALTLLGVKAEQRGRGIILASLAAATAMAVQSFSQSVWVAAAVQLFITFSVSFGMGLSSTILQITVPSQMRGRIMALNGLMFTGIMPAAALGIGAIADQIGLRMTMRGAAALYALATVAWLSIAGLWKPTPSPALQPQEMS